MADNLSFLLLFSSHTSYNMETVRRIPLCDYRPSIGARTREMSQGVELTMSVRELILRNLFYFRRTNLAVVAGVATAVAVLSGALLIGNSVRASLRTLLFQRLGAVEYVVTARRFFHEDLSAELNSGRRTLESSSSCPLIYLHGAVVLERSGSRAAAVNVYGVDERYWRFQGAAEQRSPDGRDALVGEPLAQRLGVREGDTLLLRVEAQQGVPREYLYGRRENVGRTVRLVCSRILAADRLGEFGLRPNQGEVYSIYVSLRRLQRDLAQPSRANAILLSHVPDGESGRLPELLKKSTTLQDLGVKLRSLPASEAVSVESDRVILDESMSRAAFSAAADCGMKASGVLSYLANSIRADGREIPYSVISAADLGQGALASVHGAEHFPAPSAPEGENDAIWLNEWAWRDLGISGGDKVEVDYYIWQPEGHLITRTARFRFAGVVSIGGDIDPGLAPEFPGITEARSMSAWDPPFPLDLRLIRPKDEEYWNRYKATPKAFVTLAKGQELWQSRFGRLTSVRIELTGTNRRAAIGRLEQSLHDHLDPAQTFTVTAAKEQGLGASRGTTDFGEYFVYFSFFLIASALLLSALFFRLGVEQRVHQIGALRAMGFSARALQYIMFLEGAFLSMVGSLLGLLGALAYGGFLVIGLRTWWLDAMGTRHIYLQISWLDLAVGAVSGVLVSLVTSAWTLRGLLRNSPRALLAGVLESSPVKRRRVILLQIVTPVAFLAALFVLLGSASGKIPKVEGFFTAGSLLLGSLLSLTALYLRRIHPAPLSGSGWRALFLLGTRNAMHRPGRSLLCVSLIAFATFVLVSVEAFRLDSRADLLERTGGTGGFPLVAESTLPVVYDPNSAAGREALGISSDEAPELERVRFVPFRERAGDDASCLNLYAPNEPRILGAPHSFLAEARFAFQESLASTPEEKKNPWRLLESTPPDGSIPAVGDANTIEYALHLSVGRELTVRKVDGTQARLRLVGALRDSILQGGMVISEEKFLRAFPEQEGYRFFLLDTPAASSSSLSQILMTRLADWGFGVQSTAERLAAFHRVENTYLSTFQLLGALGLILGTLGMSTVLLRNVLERRGELALLRAVGYRKRVLSTIIVVENAALMICGLVCGTVCALIAILPAFQARGSPFPVLMAGLMLIVVLIVGLISSVAAVIAAFRSPLLAALRSE